MFTVNFGIRAPEPYVPESTPVAANDTAPDATSNVIGLNEAIPLLLVDASSPDISPELISIPSPAEKWALTSEAEGPVYVNLPNAES